MSRPFWRRFSVPRSSRTPRPGAWRALAEVRMTYHRAWRDLVKDLETGDQEGLSEFDRDDKEEGNDQDQDQDQDQDGEGE